MTRARIAVIGHVEHVTLGRVGAVPLAGEIAHLEEARILAGGGGGLAFAQLVRSDAEVHFFTAIGSDDGGTTLRERLSKLRSGVSVHAALRSSAHPRVVVMIDAEGRRTIVVTEPPLQPTAEDALDWSILARCDAVYFTGADPETAGLARRARILVATGRRRPILQASGIAADVIVGSVSDPRENSPIDAYDAAPGALVLTDGAGHIRIVRRDRQTKVEPPPPVGAPKGDYGAGDSFAGALTYFLARGSSVEEAARLAGPFGAAVLAGIDPLPHQAELGLA